MKIAVSVKSQKVELEFGEDSVAVYEVREMTGKARDDYFGHAATKTRTGADGKPEIKDYSGLYSSLLSKCMYDAAGKPVPADVIDGWSASAQTALFEVARDLNGMKDDPEKKD